MRRGQKPYGRDDREKEIIDTIIFLHGKKKTWRMIANELNSRALYPRHAHRWSPMLVAAIYRVAMKNRGIQ
jgi:hypothetical protein